MNNLQLLLPDGIFAEIRSPHKAFLSTSNGFWVANYLKKIALNQYPAYNRSESKH
ncbi:hypothetical protein Atc_0415 [Acidithiobacillus caldus SM-1]|uniref:Uncharacterized protein n=1 Tax=Acidithiobacillus caldus (strain SM-1) TaxID=990288 RepID=F9ZST6_ACICS|nr:hypothetical protein Atc_0415 [Acidithiobacillus caldus SM-1]QER44410.1 hypothetical protein F0726_01339 [Acidithiobacillus caldus]